MFKLVVAVVLLGLAAASHLDKNAQVKSFENAIQGDGSYHYSFQISNGISNQETGNGGQAAGEFSHISPEGQTIQLRYTADENGFHPVGDHLPTPPPIPAYILKSLEYIRTHQPQDSSVPSSSSIKSVHVSSNSVKSVPAAPIPAPNREIFLAPLL